jgi:hypothetical protein
MIKRIAMVEVLILVTVASSWGRSPSPKPSAGTKQTVVYKNRKYRFNFELPGDWKGYSIIFDTWSGTAYPGDSAREKAEGGPLITIRHPLWSESDQRQDIPILILTHAQGEIWNDISVSAAPLGPIEIGRNAKNVFSVFPRFDISDSTGAEEVRELFRHHPIRPY